MSALDYVGTELELFAHAKHWKSYWSAQIAEYVYGDVLDVGAGIGATIEVLSKLVDARWTALEPDSKLGKRLQAAVSSGVIPRSTRIVNGVLSDLDPSEYFHTVLYIDVLEHIEDDRGQLERAARLLRPGGYLVVLAPAHNWLFTPFDKAIGHFRRYNRQGLSGLVPSGLKIQRLRYLDSAGLLASLGNRLLLQASNPTRGQIALWDNVLVRASRLLDPLTFGMLGKTVIMVCKKL